MKLIGFYNYTVILTYMSLVSSVLGMRFAFLGRMGLAIVCLAVSGVCDLFDGAVARTKRNRTEDEKNFGIQLDSLCDVVCFGVLPAVILYCGGMQAVWEVAILILYVLCAVIRLAFFNVLEIKRQKSEGGCTKEYRGLPVTAASMIFPFFYLVGLFAGEEIMRVVNPVIAFLTAVLFIADIRVAKWDVSWLLKKRNAAPPEAPPAEACEEKSPSEELV
jgi:CDP-diacylglycerol--serine O-phosphatidyltransferase